MHPIPRAPLLLGLAGVIPFVWGTLTLLSPTAADFGVSVLGPRFIGPYVQLFYGAVILAFMSGVLWGFATKAEDGRATICYVLSVIPALWAFVMTGNGPTSASLNLTIGFVGLLLIDFSFWNWGLAPQWWISLRLMLTAIVVVCLGLTAYL